jgi:hypothetical protein
MTSWVTIDPIVPEGSAIFVLASYDPHNGRRAVCLGRQKRFNFAIPVMNAVSEQHTVRL